MLLVRRGAADDPPGKEGLAALTVDMLDEGSGGRSAIEMHEALARIGAQLDSDIGSDAALLTITALSRFAGAGAAAAGRHDGAPGADRRRLRARPPAAAASPDAAARHARRGRRSGLRPSCSTATHPYGHTPLGSERSLAAMTVDDVRAFHAAMRCGRPTRRSSSSATASTTRSRGSPTAAFERLGWRGRTARRRAAARCRSRRGSTSCRGRARRSRSCASATSPCRAIRPTTTRWSRPTWCSAASSSAAST